MECRMLHKLLNWRASNSQPRLLLSPLSMGSKPWRKLSSMELILRRLCWMEAHDSSHSLVEMSTVSSQESRRMSTSTLMPTFTKLLSWMWSSLPASGSNVRILFYELCRNVWSRKKKESKMRWEQRKLASSPKREKIDAWRQKPSPKLKQRGELIRELLRLRLVLMQMPKRKLSYRIKKPLKLRRQHSRRSLRKSVMTLLK